ncbi:hypothetical protein CEXT_234601 [Caerostris extrusa]|uniref:Uncharacterized protein n=1 Tax=Caerostris extrusa TaxID=172846 RepID=A0AAV4M503_CAEEX|nr:hypothetical protein CEXT_234601 [Caerostris extrusa]
MTAKDSSTDRSSLDKVKRAIKQVSPVEKQHCLILSVQQLNSGSSANAQHSPQSTAVYSILCLLLWYVVTV